MTIAVREETGQRLQVLRGNKKWDDLMNNLINTYLGTVRRISLTDDEIHDRNCTVTGLMALEIREGDIVEMSNYATEESIRFAVVKTITPYEQNGIKADIKFDWVEI